jgi:hypothetical protein
MLYLFLLLPTLVFLIFPKRFPLYIAIVATMYMFYAWLWVDEHFFYDGKAGWKGFGIFIETISTAPFYILLHIVVIAYAWKEKDNNIMKAHIAGLALCAIHLIAVFADI